MPVRGNELNAIWSNTENNQNFCSFRSKLKHNAALLQLPIGKDSNTAGLVDIVRDRAIYFDGSFGETVRYDEVPSEYREEYDNFIDLRKISFKTQSIDQYKRSAMRVNVNAL